MREVRAIWRDDPATLSWRLWLVRDHWQGGGRYEIALREPDGQLRWEERDAAVWADDPPLLQVDDRLLREVILPAAPGIPQVIQATGELEGAQRILAEALRMERDRVDKVLDRLVPFTP